VTLRTAYTDHGEVGNSTHITRSDRGTIPLDLVRNMPGARGEQPGEHRNRQGEQWTSFVDDIRTNGIKNGLFVTVDYGEEPKLAEGNHRRDAAAELDLDEVPVEIRYFGHAERRNVLGEQFVE
jgi:hypothetical protein